jgi:hypothetical protein
MEYSMTTSERLRQSEEFSPDTIRELLRTAVADLYRNESDIDQFSSETAQTEWNLAAHLAPEIIKYFEGYSYDIDVIKVNHKNKRPDIIIRRRGPETDYNLLVVEVKREGSELGVDSDIEKIRSHWFGEGLQYQLGATINLKVRDALDIRVFANPALRNRQSA